jgi:hypothetical protein
MTLKGTPCGEVRLQKRPTSGTSWSGTQILPPLAAVSLPAAAASLTAN